MQEAIATAIKAGYTPDEIVSHLSNDPAYGDKMKQALQAGYKPAEIIGHFTGGTLAAPAAQPATGLWDVAKASVTHGAAKALTGGAADALEFAGIAPETQKWLRETSESQKAKQEAAAQVPEDAQGSASEALLKGEIGTGARRLGYLVADNVGQQAAGIAAGTLATAAAATGSVPMALGALGTGALGFLFNLYDNTSERREKGATGATDGFDMTTTSIQSVIDLMPYGKATSRLAKALLPTAAEGAKGAASEALTIFNSALHGAKPSDAADVLYQILDGGLVGSTIKGGSEVSRVPMMAGAAIREKVAERKVSAGLKAYADETRGWHDTLDKAVEAVAKFEPDRPAGEAMERAHALAQMAGATPPSFDNMSPQAQQGMAELAALQMYQARRSAETKGMGREATDMTPGRTFKGVMDDIATNLDETAKALVDTGLLTKAQVEPLKDAIAEARRHNRQAAEGGAEFGYFDTFRDKVGQLPIDPVMRNQILAQLRVLDVAAANSLEHRSQGPLEKVARAIPPMVMGGAAAGAFFHGLPVMEMAAAGMAGSMAKGAAIEKARSLDRLMGNGLPDVLRRQTAIEAFAAKHGLSAVADPIALQGMLAELQGPVAPGQQGPQGAPRGPQAAPQQRQPMAPRTATTEAPLSAPQRPVQAPPQMTMPQALDGIQGALQARDRRLGEQAAQAFPESASGWQAAIADTLGVRAGDVDAFVKQAIEGGQVPPEVAAILQGRDAIPRPIMERLTGAVRMARDNGSIPLLAQSRPDATQGGTIRNPASYEASIRQAEAAANAVRDQHPSAVAAIEAASHVEDKKAALEGYLRALAPDLQGPARATLTPLTEFGDRSPRGAPQAPPAPPQARPAGGGGGRPGSGPQVPGFGTDLGRRNRVPGAPAGGIVDGRRFKKTDDAAPAKPATGGIPSDDAATSAPNRPDVTEKLFANRKLPEGTRVAVRLNLNSNMAMPDGSMGKLQTAHDAGKGTRGWDGPALGYDTAMTVTNATFGVDQKARAAIASGEKSKFPMAAVVGGIKQNANSTEGVPIRFNPKDGHLFTDPNGHAVKGAEEVTIFGTRAYARGKIDYYDAATAPKPVGDTPSGTKFKPTLSAEAQARVDAPPMGNLPMRGTGENKRPSQPSPTARQAAEAYMAKAGLPYDPPKVFRKVDRERAARIAQAYTEMKHDPHNPEVRAAYEALVKETLAQYQAMLDSGYETRGLYTPKTDPYPNSPFEATDDMQKNNKAWVFGTLEGYGSKGIPAKELAENPMLADSGFKTARGEPMLVNDVFRAVHDYFGHAKEGFGFRWDGEENAWRSHAAMYSPLAARAATTETRGQNSWLNFGPHGEHNRKAKTEDTIFADQKIGLLPEWVMSEGREDPGADPRETRMAAEKAAAEAKDKAAEIAKGIKLTKAERSVLLNDPLDALERGEGATKRGRNGVAVSEEELLPARKKAGLDLIDWRQDGSDKKVSDLLYKEAVYHLSKADNALGWYEGKLNTAVDMVSRSFPEMASDPKALAVFKTILAITSNGQPVTKNFQQTHDIYSGIRDKVLAGDYTIPEDYSWAGTTAPSMAAGAKRFNEVVRAMGIDEALDFMRVKHRVKDLENAVRPLLGLSNSPTVNEKGKRVPPPTLISGEGKDAMVYGAAILGPKIGNGFWSNLNGNFDMPTMDRWFMTTINRLTGSLVKRDTPAKRADREAKLAPLLKAVQTSPDLASLRDHPDYAMARLGDPEAMIRFGRALWTLDNKQGFPRVGNKKPVADGKPISKASDDLRKAGKAYVNGVDGARNIAPEGAAQREWLRSVMDQTVARLGKAGIPINHADLQAVIWFPEQRFWQRKLGVGSAKTDADYEDGAVMSLLSKGLEKHAEEVYKAQGFSDAEIALKIKARRDKMATMEKEGPAHEEADADDE